MSHTIFEMHLWIKESKVQCNNVCILSLVKNAGYTFNADESKMDPDVNVTWVFILVKLLKQTYL